MTDTPRPKHPFVKGDGTRRDIYWVTDVPCSTCNPYGEVEDRVFGVISDYGGTIMLECMNCGNEERHNSDVFKYEHGPVPEDYEARLAEAQKATR